MATFPVKYFHSAMRGAPTVSGTAGTRISMLDACLINGFGATTITSLTVSSGIATATVSSGSSFEAGAIVLLAGATPAALNGEARVLTSTSTTFTFATEAPDGSATGTITAKYAPVGEWEKTYSATNKAAYRSVDPQANGHFLWIDDSPSVYSVVCGYESMSDVGTGVARFPTDALWPGSDTRWNRSLSAGSTALPWRLFADSRMFHDAIQLPTPSTTVYPKHPMSFGDLLPLAPGGDAWNTLINCCGSNAASYPVTASLMTGSGSVTQQYGVYCARSISGIGSAVALYKKPYMGATNKASGSDDVFGTGISVVDGRILMSRVVVSEGNNASAAPRAEVPGLYYIPHTGIFGLGVADGDLLSGAGDLSGRSLMVVAAGNAAANAASNGFYLVDVTGPWR